MDWSAAKSALPDDAPTLLMVHGINGDSDGKYLRWSGQLGRARQWRVVCLVLRLDNSMGRYAAPTGIIVVLPLGGGNEEEMMIFILLN